MYCYNVVSVVSGTHFWDDILKGYINLLSLGVKGERMLRGTSPLTKISIFCALSQNY